MATFYSGNSGRSTGPHLDFRVWDVEAGGCVDPAPFRSYVSSNGAGLDQFTVTSPFGADRRTYVHQGIDYATEMDTPFTVNGDYLTTFNDQGGGGRTSQYRITHEGRPFEILLMHGSDRNELLSDVAVTDGSPIKPLDTGDVGTPGSGTPAGPREEARERVQAYKDMSKEELDKAYDAMRSNPEEAEREGMKMHKAFFNKPQNVL